MNRATAGQFRASAGPAILGYCANNVPALYAILNEAQERLLIDPLAPDDGWAYGWVRMDFNLNPPNFLIVTPRDIARIILMDVRKHPVRIRNNFFEALEFGIGLQPSGCDINGRRQCSQQLQAYERDTVPTLSPLLAPSYVRIFPTNNADVSKQVLLQGNDINGVPVTSNDSGTGNTILGEQISLSFPFVDSVNVYSSITGIQKSVTYGRVEFMQVDSNSGAQTALSEMQPNETTSLYRTYFVNGLQCCPSQSNVTPGPISVQAWCKLDLIPVQADQDYLLINNIPALLDEAHAIRLSRMENSKAIQQSEQHHASALRLMFGQLDHLYGKVQTSISLPLFGSDRVHPQRL